MEEADLKTLAKKKKSFYIPRRYLLCLMLFGAFFTTNCQRSCLSVAIVAMAGNTTHWSGGKMHKQPAEFDWDSEKKGILLGAFFYGFLVLQIPAGTICNRFGGKIVLGWAVFIGSILNAAIPFLVRFNEDFLFVARVIQGFAFGVVLPTNHYFWGTWAPYKEKSTLVSCSIAGLSAGMLLSFPLSGLLCTYGFAGGWPSVFYVFGGAGLLWTVAWYFLAANTPLEHPSISEEELAIMIHLKRESEDEKKEKIYTPWCKILTSLPVWGIIIANFTFDTIYYTTLITMPLFLRDVHKFNVTTTGFISAMPWLFMTVMMTVAGVLADKIKFYLTAGRTRKLIFTCGATGASVFLISAGYMKSSEATIAFLCASVSFFGFMFSGFMVNPMDIAPRHAGTIIGISNSMGAIPGFVGPGVAGIITKNGSAGEWLEVFYMLAGVSIIGGVIYSLIGSGEQQSWANYDPLKEEEVETGKLCGETAQECDASKTNEQETEKIQGVKKIDEMRDLG